MTSWIQIYGCKRNTLESLPTRLFAPLNEDKSQVLKTIHLLGFKLVKQ